MAVPNSMENLYFTVPEILSLIGLIQCVYVLVYMAFRAGRPRYVFLPFAYFFSLGAAFLAGFAERFWDGVLPHYDLVLWALWMAALPLSVLLMIQIARISELPPARSFLVLLLLPVAFIGAVGVTRMVPDTNLQEWLALGGVLAGAASLMMMWAYRKNLHQLSHEPAGRDRYWLIIALVLVNLFFLGTMLLGLTPVLGEDDTRVVRTIWGLGFVYLAGTSLFRIYPQAVRLSPVRGAGDQQALNSEEQAIAAKIENLMNLDKVYQEPSYNRASLAKELNLSEAQVSRIINLHFGKTLPQLFNERRVAEAKRLLAETNAPVKTIAEDVGFNSIASFNRVFRDLEHLSPGAFRAAQGKGDGSL